VEAGKEIEVVYYYPAAFASVSFYPLLPLYCFEIINEMNASFNREKGLILMPNYRVDTLLTYYLLMLVEEGNSTKK
jgi:hypothetical protein